MFLSKNNYLPYIGANRGVGLPYKKRGIPIVRNVSLNVTYLACGRALFDVSPTIAACGLVLTLATFSNGSLC